MKYRDYHLHSEFSFDSSETIEKICEKAVQEGIVELAITDHAEFPLSEAAPFPDLEKRDSVIEKCRDLYPQLSILSGLEIGQPWKAVARDSFCPSLDFIIASVHSLDGYQNSKCSDMTCSETRRFLDDYLSQLIFMAETEEYDVVGHTTYLFRFLPEKMIEAYPPEFFRDSYAELFSVLIKRGKGIEVNCSGLRMPTIGKTFPSHELLILYRDLGGKVVTVGSDGHSCRSAFLGLKQGYDVLKSAGFDYIATYKKRELSFLSLEAVD